ncbi:DUF2207 family protein [Phytohabitans flavus]|uniref:DUF2207 family protein n=1 Tax=Phytohabitans flavus TaxID=1076124 RepID=UPI00362861A4
MTTIDLLIEIGLPAVSLGVWILANTAARIYTRPAAVAPAPATMDFPGPESPAVVGLIADGWRISTGDAAAATLLDLAARGYVELRQNSADARHTTVHLTRREPGDLNEYELQVYNWVAQRSTNGVVPLTALAFTDAGRYATWARRVNRYVVEEAQRLGLSRPRYSRAMIAALVVLAGLVAAGIAVSAMHVAVRLGDPAERTGQYLSGLGAWVMAFAIISAGARSKGGQRDTTAGRAAAARWLGVREWLAGHESFADLPPSAVAVWHRYLAYGVALGKSRVASEVIDLGMSDHRRIWSSYTGRWRQVDVSYPRYGLRVGQALGWPIGHVIITAWIGIPMLVYGREVSAAFQLFGLALLTYGAYLVVRVTVALATPVSVTGQVIWRGTWKTKQVGGGDSEPSRTVPANYHLVIDDGHSDRTRAWILPAELADGFRIGDVVTAKARLWTRRVVKVTQLRAERRGPHDDLPETGEVVARATVRTRAVPRRNNCSPPPRSARHSGRR